MVGTGRDGRAARGGTDHDPPPSTTATTRAGRSPLPALAGVGALAAFAGAVVAFNDPLRGARTPAEAAERLADSSAPLTGLLLAIYALLAIAVVGTLAARLGRDGDTAPCG